MVAFKPATGCILGCYVPFHHTRSILLANTGHRINFSNSYSLKSAIYVVLMSV